MAAAQGNDIDIFGFYREGALAALNLFHLRNGRIVDRREFFWEDLPPEEDAEDVEGADAGDHGAGFSASHFLASLVKQIYLDQEFVPSAIHVPVDFDDRELLAEVLSEKKERRVEIQTPQRGQKRALLELVEKNARHSFDQRFRVLKPSSKAIAEALQEGLNLPEPPRRIECFDISHVQGSDTVGSLVVWEDGKMRKAEYRKFIIRTVEGSDDFASMREVVARRYRRLQEEQKPLPGAGAGGRRPGPAPRRRGRAGAVRHHQPAACGHRQKGGDHLRLRAGGRAGRAGPALAPAALGANGAGRGTPVRRQLPPPAAGVSPADHRAAGDSRHWRKDSAQTAPAIRQPARVAAALRGTAGASGRARPGGTDFPAPARSCSLNGLGCGARFSVSVGSEPC